MHSHAERGNERAKNMPEKPKLDDYMRKAKKKEGYEKYRE